MVALTSVVFTALVAGGALGIAWLFIGPALAGVVEIASSHFPLGPGVREEGKPEPAAPFEA